ncbi:hypothetical protein MXB_2312 [Myxobolus squamalis]|nr:hypothetical protein MXB_2312 [Myxobolus squamalis]
MASLSILLLDKVVVESEYVRDVTWELFRRLMVLSATMLTEGCLWEPDDRVRALGRIYPFDEH